MPTLLTALASIRNYTGSLSGQAAAFWAVTLLVALLLPSPIAAPVLVARLRRPALPRPAARLD